MSRLSSMIRILRDAVTGCFSCQERCSGGESDASGLARWHVVGGRHLGERKRENEGSSISPAAAGGSNRAPHVVHGNRRRVQTEAVAVRFGRKAEAKDVFQVLIAN